MTKSPLVEEHQCSTFFSQKMCYCDFTDDSKFECWNDINLCKWKSVSQIVIHLCIYLYAVFRIIFDPLFTFCIVMMMSNVKKGFVC